MRQREANQRGRKRERARERNDGQIKTYMKKRIEKEIC